MKKKFSSLIIVLAFMFVPNFVSAASFNMSVSCGSATAGGTTTCTLSGSSGSTNIATVEANISVNNGATISNFKKTGSNWQGDGSFSGSKGSFLFYTDTPSKNSFKIAQFTVKTPKVGSVSVSVTGIKGGDNDTGDMISCGNKTATINVKEKTTKPTTTRKPTTPTQKTTSSIPTTKPTQPVPLALTSVKVDDFNVTFEDGVYYATVNSNTEKVTISATAGAGISIIGTGQRNLAIGKNAVDLVLRNGANQTATFQLIITRPDGVVISDTKLTSLKVADYAFAFSPDTKDYTITVPSSTEEIYVIAESYSDDVVITGAGLQSLSKGTNTIHIKVTYGDLASTEYTIKVKRSYMSVIMWIIIGTLGAGLVAMGIYANINRKAAVSKAVAEKNKQIAQNNRATLNQAPQVQLNGENVVSTGHNVAVAQPVSAPVTPAAPIAPTPQSINVATPAKSTVVATPNPQVVQASSAPQMIKTAPPAQVKVVKTTVVPVKQPTAQKVVNEANPAPTVNNTSTDKPVI